MKKRYDLPEEEEDFEKNMVNEPMTAAYGMERKMEILPALTEEELAECMTGDELRKRMHKFIDELFDKNENSLHLNR